MALTYSTDIKTLLTACGHRATIYDREPVRDGNRPIRPVTERERKLIATRNGDIGGLRRK